MNKADLIAEVGFSVESTGFDPARLRVVSHEGDQNPAATAMYYGHRDTWYSNPQSMITWWLPLHNVGAAESFEFFPECFGKAVGNDSEIFNFDRWVEGGSDKLIGWQNANTGLTAQYPQLLEEPSGTALPVECCRGDILLFAGQHLHRTQKQATHMTRFSLDFRTVDLNDHESGRGAVNVQSINRFVVKEVCTAELGIFVTAKSVWEYAVIGSFRCNCVLTANESRRDGSV